MGDLPVLTQSAISLIFLIQKAFGEKVGTHGVSRFSGNNQEMIGVTVIGRTVPDMFPEPVPLDKEVLGPIGDALMDCQLKSSVIVLKDVTMKSGKTRGREVKRLGDLKK